MRHIIGLPGPLKMPTVPFAVLIFFSFQSVFHLFKLNLVYLRYLTHLWTYIFLCFRVWFIILVPLHHALNILLPLGILHVLSARPSLCTLPVPLHSATHKSVIRMTKIEFSPPTSSHLQIISYLVLLLEVLAPVLALNLVPLKPFFTGISSGINVTVPNFSNLSSLSTPNTIWLLLNV